MTDLWSSRSTAFSGILPTLAISTLCRTNFKRESVFWIEISVASWNDISKKLLLHDVTFLMLTSGFSFLTSSRKSRILIRWGFILTTFLNGSVQMFCLTSPIYDYE